MTPLCGRQFTVPIFFLCVCVKNNLERWFGGAPNEKYVYTALILHFEKTPC